MQLQKCRISRLCATLAIASFIIRYLDAKLIRISPLWNRFRFSYASRLIATVPIGTGVDGAPGIGQGLDTDL
ncbi:MAG TPA: hypothetical protein VF783_18890 [Terriglobales bacterium]